MITLATNKNNDKNSDIYSVSFAIEGNAKGKPRGYGWL
jgi:hypothetical protein